MTAREEVRVGDEVVGAEVYYDDHGPGARWWARYYYEGQEVDDLQKTWHPDMPKRRDAERGAMRIAVAYARGLARSIAAKVSR